MVDWALVAANGLWLGGLALVLAVLSFADDARRPGAAAGPSLRQAVLRNGWARLGGLCVSAGLLLTSGSGLEKSGWALLTLYQAVAWWRQRAAGARLAALRDGQDPVPVAPVRPPRWVGVSAVAGRLVATELLWLGLAAVFILLSLPGHTLLLIVLPALWVCRFLARGHFIPRTPLDWAIALLLVMVLVSVLTGVDLAGSLSHVENLLLGVALYYGIVEATATERRLHLALTAFAAAGLLLVLAGLLGTDWSGKVRVLSDLAAQLPRPLRRLSQSGSGFNPNVVSGALLWVIPLQITLASRAWTGGWVVPVGRWLRRGALLLLPLLSLGVLLLSQSRGAVISFLISVALLLGLAAPRLRPLLLAGVLAAGLLTLVVGPGQIVDFLFGGSQAQVPTGDAVATLQDRVTVWNRAIEAIKDFPLTGTGMYSFHLVLPLLYPIRSAASVAPVDNAHNEFLQAALDLGLPGLVAYLAVWLLGAALVVRAWRAGGPAWQRAGVAGLGAGLLASAISGMTNPVVLVARPGIFFWGGLALLAALARPRSEASWRPGEGRPQEERLALAAGGATRGGKSL